MPSRRTRTVRAEGRRVMATHIDSPPEVARGRIKAIRDVAKELAIRTGGDQAECMFELIAACVLIGQEARMTSLPEELIARIAPDAAACVEEWFADELKEIRCKHG